MARKTRRKRCFHCEKPFKNPQAVRAHQLHCAVRRLKMQAEAAVRHQPVHSSIKRKESESHRPGPESKENKLLLLDTHEGIKQLLLVLEYIIASAHFFFRAAFSHVAGNIPPEEWAKLYVDLDDVERDFAQMECRRRLDEALLYKIYHRLRAIRATWLGYREHDYLKYEQRQLLESEADMNRQYALLADYRKIIEDDRALLDDVVTKVKRLLVAA